MKTSGQWGWASAVVGALALSFPGFGCSTNDLSLGENALAKDGGGADAPAEDVACRPIPPIDPGACDGGAIRDVLDERGCWVSYQCEALDGGPADAGDEGSVDGGACPGLPIGECVAVVPGACQQGFINPSFSCGGIGSSCCISCPTLSQPQCPSDRQNIRNIKNQYGCTTTLECFATFNLADADSGAVVNAKAGDDLVVALTMNASTGYQWSVSQAGGLPAPTTTITPGSAPGSDGTHTFAWTNVGTGSYSVTLIYKRPFETVPLKTFTFTANVAP